MLNEVICILYIFFELKIKREMDLNWLDELALLDYTLPKEQIALHPVSPRDHSKLLC
jgi:hypothetical protein